MKSFKINNTQLILLRTAIVAACCVGIIGIIPNSSTTQAAPGGECKSLTVEQSSDKNYYLFTVTGSGPDIKGYSIDFGDRQSYNFDFQKTPVSNRGTAKVKHTYQKEGKFTASAKIVTSTTSESSPYCVVQITIGQPIPSELPVTGSRDSLIFFIALILGVVTYGIAFFIQNKYTRIDSTSSIQ